MKTPIKKRYLYLLSLLSGLLFTFAWPSNGFPLLLFVALVPLLFIEDNIYNNKKHFHRLSFFWYAYIALLIWNVLTTYWIYYSTAVGSILAITLNALIMAITLSAFHYVRTVLKHKSAYISLIIFWITYEYLHLNWDLSWSWLNLGNGFANHPAWIQWYEYTGTLGGTLWVLVVNYMIFRAIKFYLNNEKTSKYRSLYAAACCDLILIPIIISVIIYYHYEDKGKPVNVVSVQPNIDPYNEKFGGMTSEQQLAKLLKIARLKTDDKTDLLVGPETAIPEGVWEDKLDESPSVDSLKQFQKNYPHLNILIGLSSYRMYKKSETPSATASIYSISDNRRDTAWFDGYNTGMMLNSKGIQLYHKSKLVPFVEKTPFPRVLKPLEKFAINLGGTVGSLGEQDERTVFYSNDRLIKAAPVICYESVYGEYVTDYVKNGANILCVITNDGWWEDTPGYKQHFKYASLRAIETRRSIVQSANTGISGFINQRGEILQATAWWKGDVIKQTLLMNDKITLYVRYGDYLGRTALYMSIVVFLYTIFLNIKRKFKKV